MRRSKLHLVDLAGSERIKRTGIQGGALLRESKHINLSLHFLEQVIVALQVPGLFLGLCIFSLLFSLVLRCVCWKRVAVRSGVGYSCTRGVHFTSACPSLPGARHRQVHAVAAPALVCFAGGCRAAARSDGFKGYVHSNERLHRGSSWWPGQQGY